MVGELINGEIREYEIHPEDFGLQMVSSRNLQVSNSTESKARILEALDDAVGPARDIVALNAATALYASGVASSIADGLEKARAAISSGAARRKLAQFIEITQQLGSHRP
jgi:anthranilate phosphoribosyltransferase